MTVAEPWSVGVLTIALGFGHFPPKVPETPHIRAHHRVSTMLGGSASPP
jgi:hypothetical protein